MAATDHITDALNTFNKAIDVVMREPRGPKRWRAANNLWLTLSFKNHKIYKEVCTENRKTREAVDRFGRIKGMEKLYASDKTFRESLNIPAGAYTVICKADPDVFKEKKNAKLFFNEFREYRTRDVY